MTPERIDPSTPVPPGSIRLLRLKEDGRLQTGDLVQTARLGVCTVAYIQSADTLCVKASDGCYYTISGLGFKARLESRSRSAGADAGATSAT